MNRWTFLTGDNNWQDYGGSWARKAPDGSWYVLKFDNLLEALGEREFKDSGLDRYTCEVKRIDFAEISLSTVIKVLRTYDYRLDIVVNGANHVVSPGGVDITVKDGTCYVGLTTSQGDEIEGSYVERCLVECLVGYGLGAPLAEFSGKSYPERVRAAARRAAESFMASFSALDEALTRKVNRIGSTAAEYGRRDIDSAIARGMGPEADLMRKLSGYRRLGETATEYAERLALTGATPATTTPATTTPATTIATTTKEDIEKKS